MTNGGKWALGENGHQDKIDTRASGHSGQLSTRANGHFGAYYLGDKWACWELRQMKILGKWTLWDRYRHWGKWALEANGHLRKMSTRKYEHKGKWALNANKGQGKIKANGHYWANGYFGDKGACWGTGTNGDLRKWTLGEMGTLG